MSDMSSQNPMTRRSGDPSKIMTVRGTNGSRLEGATAGDERCAVIEKTEQGRGASGDLMVLERYAAGKSKPVGVVVRLVHTTCP